MDATGRGGVPGFNAPFPRMNIPENNLPNFNLPNFNMAFPAPMRPPNFPTYNRSSFQNQVYFANNPEVQGSSFWMGAFEQGEPAPKTFVNENAAAPQEAPPAVKKKKPFRKRQKKKTRAAKTLISLREITRKLGIDAGAVKNPLKPKPTVGSQPQNPGGSATNPQQPIPTVGSQPQNPGAKNPQQPILPSISQPANEVTQKEKTGTQNGDLKRHREETTEADVPTPPDKKGQTEERDPPAQRPNFEWRGNTSTMFSCSLCQYFTPGEVAIQRHLLSYQHKTVLKHLSIFFPEDRVQFLHEYITFKTKQMSMEKNRCNLPQIDDSFKGIGTEHFIHRIQAAYCQICDLVIPEGTNHVLAHIRSTDHSRKRKATLRATKTSSIMAAKDLLMDSDVLQRLRLYNIGENPFMDAENYIPPDTPGHPSRESKTDGVLVAEEDDDDDNSDMCCDSNEEDATADGGASQEVPDHHNECPVIEVKDSGSKVVLPMGPETSSTTEEIVNEEEIEEEEAAEAP